MCLISRSLLSELFTDEPFSYLQRTKTSHPPSYSMCPQTQVGVNNSGRTEYFMPLHLKTVYATFSNSLGLKTLPIFNNTGWIFLVLTCFWWLLTQNRSQVKAAVLGRSPPGTAVTSGGPLCPAWPEQVCYLKKVTLILHAPSVVRIETCCKHKHFLGNLLIPAKLPAEVA